MRHLFRAAVLAAVVVSMPVAVAAEPRNVPSGPERTAILDALRPAIEARIGPNVEFVVESLRVANGYAVVDANPQRRGGGQIDGHRYFGSDFDNMGGLEVTAVLQYRNRRWNLIGQRIGATDVWYCGEGLPASQRTTFGC